MSQTVHILLSTHNGADWLEAQLDSLLQQTWQDWVLLIRDDASSDGTAELLQAWQAQWPHKVASLECSQTRLGSTASFSTLVMRSQADYLLFCDQDDIWLPQKIERLMQRMQRLEAQYNARTPLLVHADMTVVDAQRRVLADSFWQQRHFKLAQSRQAYLLQNTVSGCATLFNRAAALAAFPAPAQAMQHDRWLALVCAWQGQVVAVPQVLVLYRQHANNTLGAAGLGWRVTQIHARVVAWSQQAEAFLQRYGAHLAVPDYQRVAALARLQYLRAGTRRLQIVRHRLFRAGVLANVALLLFA